MTIKPFEGNELLKLADRLTGWFVERKAVTWRAASVYRNSNQSIAPGGGYVSITFTTVRQDTSSLFDISNPTRLTCPISGWYIVSAQCSMGPDLGAVNVKRAIRLAINGAGEANQDYWVPPGQVTTMSVAELLFLDAGDYIELQVSNGGLAAVNALAASFTPGLQAARMP